MTETDQGAWQHLLDVNVLQVMLFLGLLPHSFLLWEELTQRELTWGGDLQPKPLRQTRPYL